MAKTVISPEEGAELKRLYEELSEANKILLATLRTDPPRHELKGEALKRHLAAEAEVTAIVRRIKEILGTTGEHWMA